MTDEVCGCRYERRLLLEIDRFNRLQADKVDASYMHDEKLRTMEEAHRKVGAAWLRQLLPVGA